MKNRGLILLTLLTLAGCAATQYRTAVVMDDRALVAGCSAVVEQTYPDLFRMAQRIVIVQGGEQFDCIGALIVQRGVAFRALALGEMGGKLFDLQDRDGLRQVLKKPGGMPENPLVLGVMDDIQHLFSAMAGSTAWAGRSAAGHPVLVVPGEGGVAEFRFDATGCKIVSSIEAQDGRVMREARYSDHRVFPGWHAELPGRIVLDNLRWHYRLEIELLQIMPTDDSAGAFEAAK